MNRKWHTLLMSTLLLVLAVMLTGCGSKESFVISLKDGVATDIVMDGEDLRSFVVKDAQGGDIRIVCEDAYVDGDNNIVLRDGGHLFTTTPTPGIRKINLKNIWGADTDDEESWVEFGGGYGSNEAVVEHYEEMVWGQPRATGATHKDANHKIFCEPPYLQVSSWKGEVIIDNVTVYYNSSYTDSGFERVYLDENFYGSYGEGMRYDPTREGWDGYEDLSFYLTLVPVNHGKERDSGDWVYGTTNYRVGDLYDQSGNVKSKEEPLVKGDQLGVFVCGQEYKLELPIMEKVSLSNLHEEMPYFTAAAVGDLNVLVVPFYFKDQADQINDTRMENIKTALGRVMDESGNVTTYTIGDGLTLSEYFEMVSYGKLHITSFVTDWYGISGKCYMDEAYDPLNVSYVDEIQKWVEKNYADLSGTLDQDGNGYYDAVILICAGEGSQGGYTPAVISGAVQTKWAYGPERLEKGKTAIGYAVVANENTLDMYYDYTLGQPSAEILIHEMGHVFGLVDYYDATYGMIDAVGEYDMQSGNVGDWNPYSKFAAGWIEPVVITPEEIEAKGTIEVTLRSYANTGDTLLIPVKGTAIGPNGMSPFEEYIAVDFFTADGVNSYYTPRYGLEGISGVMVYHINGTSVIRDLVDETTNKPYSIVHELFHNAKNNLGQYQVEVIQKPGINTFTGGDWHTILSYDDFFYAGDSFSVATHSEFFYNGLMDNGTEFPYQIKVKSMNANEAVVEISLIK